MLEARAWEVGPGDVQGDLLSAVAGLSVGGGSGQMHRKVAEPRRRACTNCRVAYRERNQGQVGRPRVAFRAQGGMSRYRYGVLWAWMVMDWAAMGLGRYGFGVTVRLIHTGVKTSEIPCQSPVASSRE